MTTQSTGQSKAEERLRLIQGRAFSIGVGNIALLVSVGISAAIAYKDAPKELNTFLIQVLLVIAGCLILGSERVADRAVKPLLFDLDKTTPIAVPAKPTSHASESRGKWTIALVFICLLTLIALDFYAIGRFVNSTGGVFASPYAQFPATMLILGGVMASRNATYAVILFGGLTYFWSMQETTVLGEVADLKPQESRATFLFLFIIAINLVVSFFVSWRQKRQTAELAELVKSLNLRPNPSP